MLRTSLQRLYQAAVSDCPSFDIFRVVLSAFLLTQAFCLLPDVPMLFEGDGVFRSELIESLSEPALRVRHFERVVAYFGGSGKQLVMPVFAMYMAALAGVMISRNPTPFLSIALVTKMMWLENSPGVSYGVDQFSTICLFVLTLASIAGHLAKSSIPQIQNLILGVGLRFVLALCYFSSGIEKMLGFDWWNGNSMWRAAHFSDHGLILVKAFQALPGLAVILGLGTLLIEFAYPLGILWQKTRFVWALSTIALHLGIIFSMGLTFFGLLMILMNVSAWCVPEIRKAGGKLRLMIRSFRQGSARCPQS
jgi:hypothetical protein